MKKAYFDLPHLPMGAFLPTGNRLTRLYSGGGGSDAGHYENLEKLYEEQAQSAKLLRQQAEKYLPGMTDAYAGQVNKVLDAGYAERQADQAGADMAGANAMERSATEKTLASMGVNPADRRYATALAAQETTNAARMAAGKNSARNEAEQMQRAVAQDAVGTFTGQSNNAAAQLSGAASGMSNMYGQQIQQQQAKAAQTSNNVGAAIGGTMAAGSLMNWWADGGEIRVGEGNVLLRPGGIKRIERHMLGGVAGTQQGNRGFFAQSDVAAPNGFTPPQNQNSSNGLSTALGAYRQGMSIGRPIMRGIQAKGAGAGMSPEQARAAADAYDSAASNATSAAQAREYQGVANSIRSGAGVSRLGPEGFAANQGASASQAFGTGITETTTAASQAAAAGTEAAAAGGSSAASAFAPTAASLTEAAGVGEAAALGSAAAESGMAMAGASGAAAGTGAAAGGLGTAGAAIGTALPWVGAALAAGSLMGLFADGGEVENGNPTQDLRDGNKVEGPGSHTDDIVPALLSDGEHVINAEAAALVGHDALQDLNRLGLKMRNKGVIPSQIKTGLGIGRTMAV